MKNRNEHMHTNTGKCAYVSVVCRLPSIHGYIILINTLYICLTLDKGKNYYYFLKHMHTHTHCTNRTGGIKERKKATKSSDVKSNLSCLHSVRFQSSFFFFFVIYSFDSIRCAEACDTRNSAYLLCTFDFDRVSINMS